MDRPSPISFVPTATELDATSVRADSLSAVGGAPPLARCRILREREAADRRLRDLSTRILNVALASTLLVLVLPLMAVIALAVKLSSSGPVIFSQERVGLDRRRGPRRRGARRFQNDRRKRDQGGRVFRIYKFRTMRASNGTEPQVWASRNDPRVTPVGRFLRAHRLDELPQLINVLKGDMNLVGPRPEQPGIFEELRGSIQQYPYRQKVRPGITGWAQVNHRYDESLEDVRRKLYYDLEYVRRQSVIKDLKIIAKTPRVMLFREGSQ
jgi:lipopolysaccharide/colanic/teichoic acid biosynthesis glycosyltransferase